MAAYDTILVEARDRVGLVPLHRPAALHALNRKLTSELLSAVQVFDADPNIGCIVITGSEKAFAAGADIKEMQPMDYVGMYDSDWFADWQRLPATRTPEVAAVA